MPYAGDVVACRTVYRTVDTDVCYCNGPSACGIGSRVGLRDDENSGAYVKASDG